MIVAIICAVCFFVILLIGKNMYDQNKKFKDEEENRFRKEIERAESYEKKYEYDMAIKAYENAILDIPKEYKDKIEFYRKNIENIKLLCTEEKNKISIFRDIIGKLLEEHFNKIFKEHKSNIQINNFFMRTESTIKSIILANTNKLMKVIYTNEIQSFTEIVSDNNILLNYNTNNKTIISVDIYPSNKNIIKSKYYYKSYLNKLSNLLNIHSNGGLEINSSELFNIELFDIMIFVDNNNYEIDMGIAIPKYGIAIYPADLLSEDDKKMLSQN